MMLAIFSGLLDAIAALSASILFDSWLAGAFVLALLYSFYIKRMDRDREWIAAIKKTLLGDTK